MTPRRLNSSRWTPIQCSAKSRHSLRNWAIGTSSFDFFAARYRGFQQLGFVRPSIRPVLMAHLLIGMFDELLNAFVLTDADSDLDALAAQLADFEWNGIRPH